MNKIYQIELPTNQLCQIIQLAIRMRIQSFSINFHYPSTTIPTDLWRFCTNCDGMALVFQDMGPVSDNSFISPFNELNLVEKEVIASVINGSCRSALKMIFQLEPVTLSNLMKNRFASILIIEKARYLSVDQARLINLLKRNNLISHENDLLTESLLDPDLENYIRSKL